MGVRKRVMVQGFKKKAKQLKNASSMKRKQLHPGEHLRLFAILD